VTLFIGIFGYGTGIDNEDVGGVGEISLYDSPFCSNIREIVEVSE
jgi:hypothetical protein